MVVMTTMSLVASNGRKKNDGVTTTFAISSKMVLLAMMLLLSFAKNSSSLSTFEMSLTVNPHSKECLYEYVERNDSVTISVFISAGAELKGGLLLEGPLPGSINNKDLDSALELQKMVENHEKHPSRQVTKIEENVNFERMISASANNNPYSNDEDDADSVNGDDDMNLWLMGDDEEGGEIDDEMMEKRRVEHRKHTLMQRKKALEARLARMERMKANNIIKDGEAVQRTMTVAQSGWYRACVKGTWYQITAELEMRKASELGGVDADTGHVFSYSKYEDQQETAFLEADSLEEEEGMLAKNEDFDTVKSQLEHLRHLLSDIQQNQLTERHRLIIHAATNEHSHSRMVLSSLFQTILFMAVTGFQVYTIRRWFRGDPDNTLIKK